MVPVPQVGGGVDVAGGLVGHHILGAAVVQSHLRPVGVEDGHALVGLVPHRRQGAGEGAAAVRAHQGEGGADEGVGAVGQAVYLHQRRHVDDGQVLVGVGVGGEQGACEGEQEQQNDDDEARDGGGLMPEAIPHVAGEGAVLAPDLLPVLAGLFFSPIHQSLPLGHQERP